MVKFTEVDVWFVHYEKDYLKLKTWRLLALKKYQQKLKQLKQLNQFEQYLYKEKHFFHSAEFYHVSNKIFEIPHFLRCLIKWKES